MSSDTFEAAQDATKRGTRLPDKPTWAVSGCGCCHGLEWGGEEPRECRDCGGSGGVYVHLPTGSVALWPGGPFNGDRRPDLEVQDA